MTEKNRSQTRFLAARISPRRLGWLIFAGLAFLTLLAHLTTRQSAAVSTPTAVAPSPAAPVPGVPVKPGHRFHGPDDPLLSFSGRLDRHAVLRGGDSRVKLELALAGAERPVNATAPRIPTDVVVVLDRSGSMSGEKIVNARGAVLELLDRLEPDDRFALVAYASDVQLVVPLTPATASARAGWRRRVETIDATTGTNMSSGLDLALDVTSEPRPGRAARMILISDGQANEGDSSVEGLSARAARGARSEVLVSTIGVGTGFNEFLMTSVADAGAGNFYYLKHAEQMAEVFTAEFEASRETVASAVAVAIAPGPGVEVIDAAGYPLERRGGEVVFRPGNLFAGQERRIWVTLEVPNDRPAEHGLGTFAVAYADPAAPESPRRLAFTEEPRVTCVAEENVYLASFDRDVWARSAVEEDYNKMLQQVALQVKDGKREEARQEIEVYRAQQTRLNQKLKVKEVQERLEGLQELLSEVDDAFEGPDQRIKRNDLSKMNQAKGYDGRRVGSKKVPKSKQ